MAKEFRPVGLPIQESHVNQLEKLVMAPSASAISGLAMTVSICKDQYDQCCRFSTNITDEEGDSLEILTGNEGGDPEGYGTRPQGGLECGH